VDVGVWNLGHTLNHEINCVCLTVVHIQSPIPLVLNQQRMVIVICQTLILYWILCTKWYVTFRHWHFIFFNLVFTDVYFWNMFLLYVMFLYIFVQFSFWKKFSIIVCLFFLYVLVISVVYQSLLFLLSSFCYHFLISWQKCTSLINKFPCKDWTKCIPLDVELNLHWC